MPEKAFSKIGNIAIYVYWSRNKTLEANTLSYVQELINVSELILFVSNSKIDSKDVTKLTNLGATFLQRDNTGFDFWGWKEGISRFKDNIKKAKNLILCNSSCFLAFNSLDSLLLKMNSEADLWGISSFEDKHTPFHLQSYFLLFKRSILQDWDGFISFWDNLPQMPGWKEAVELGELRLTNFFLDKGFRCKAITTPTSLPSKDVNPSFYFPVPLFKAGSPLLKKKIFTEDYHHYLFASCGEAPREAMNYVRENGGHYNEILSDLISSSTPTKLNQTLQLNFIVGGNSSYEELHFKSEVAVICFVFYDDMVQYISNILARFNGVADVYIVSTKKELLDSYKERLTNKLPTARYRLQTNRGRNEAAYFITCKDVLQNYQLFCGLHDKKTSHAKPALQGIDFMRHCEQNLCPSSSSIIEIIQLFKKNPLLGLLVPPLPFFGNFISSVYNPLGRNMNSMRLLNKKFFEGRLFPSGNPDVFSAPFGGMFWARSAALAPLYSSNLSFEDFPKEPIKNNDGTILHALERCYPMVARYSGFYTARVINISLVPLIYNNLLYFCITLPKKTRIFFAIKDILKVKLSHFPLLYELARAILRKVSSH